MDIAVAEAQKALAEKEVPVGCAVFYNGNCIDRAHNLTNKNRDPLAHAEMLCLGRLESVKYDPKMLSLFVTCEPCIMCMAAILKLGVGKVTYACKNTRFGGLTVYDVASAIPNKEVKVKYKPDPISIQLLKQFYDQENPSAPPEKRKRKTGRKAEATTRQKAGSGAYAQ